MDEVDVCISRWMKRKKCVANDTQRKDVVVTSGLMPGSNNRKNIKTGQRIRRGKSKKQKTENRKMMMMMAEERDHRDGSMEKYYKNSAKVHRLFFLSTLSLGCRRLASSPLKCQIS